MAGLEDGTEIMKFRAKFAKDEITGRPYWFV
jgi:hypothetical protein